MSLYYRKVSLPLSHLTDSKLKQIKHLIRAYRIMVNQFIKILYHQTTNLKLYNQDCPKDTQLALNKTTLSLLQPKHCLLSERYKSQALKQALEVMASIDHKQTEQAYVLKHHKRLSKRPIFYGYPQLDSKFITLQFKTDDPTLLQKYPTHSVSEKTALNKQGEAVTKTVKTVSPVQAFSSEQWNSQFGVTHFTCCVRLSLGSEKKQRKCLLFGHLHAQIKKWLLSEQTHHSSLTQHSVLVPFVELHPHHLGLVFQLIHTESPIETAPMTLKQRQSLEQSLPLVINLSNRPVSQYHDYVGEVANYHPHFKPSPTTLEQKAQWLSQLQSIVKEEPESVYGCDIGWKKLCVLTHQDKAGLKAQEQALFVGTDHPQWLEKLDQAHTHYQQTVNQYKKHPSALHQRQKSQAKACYHRLKRAYAQWIHQQVQSLPWDKMKVLVLENLASIKIGGSNKRSMGHKNNKVNAQWALSEVVGRLNQYSQQSGTLLIYVSPAYTSQQCPLCETVPAEKQRVKETYQCRCCTGTLIQMTAKKPEWVEGVTLDADYVGSHNMRKLGVKWIRSGEILMLTKLRESG